MTTTVFANATIVTCDAARTVLHDSALAIDGSRIAAVGPTAQVQANYPDAEVVDGRGKARRLGRYDKAADRAYVTAPTQDSSLPICD